MRQRIYIDTSVIGGCYDEEFQLWSNILIDEIIDGKRIALISDITVDEIEDAPKKVRNKFSEILKSGNVDLIESNSESKELAAAYISENALTNKSFEDALHIAIATLNNSTLLTSWNFKHIVNFDRIRLFNAVNLKKGYNLLEIRSPRDIINIENYES